MPLQHLDQSSLLDQGNTPSESLTVKERSSHLLEDRDDGDDEERRVASFPPLLDSSLSFLDVSGAGGGSQCELISIGMVPRVRNVMSHPLGEPRWSQEHKSTRVEKQDCRRRRWERDINGASFLKIVSFASS